MSELLADSTITGVVVSSPIEELSAWKVWSRQDETIVKSLTREVVDKIKGKTSIYGTCVNNSFSRLRHELLERNPFDVRFFAYDPVNRIQYKASLLNVHFTEEADQQAVCKFLAEAWIKWQPTHVEASCGQA